MYFNSNYVGDYSTSPYTISTDLFFKIQVITLTIFIHLSFHYLFMNGGLKNYLQYLIV